MPLGKALDSPDTPAVGDDQKVRGVAIGSDPPRRGKCRRPTIALIDDSPLRRTSTLNMLRAYLRLPVRPFKTIAELSAQGAVPNDDLSPIILSVGGRRVQQDQLRSLSTLAPNRLVVMSDLEEPDQVLTTFRCGGRGYIPTTLEPSLVIEAMRLVLAGGLFAPAHVVVDARAPRREPRTEGAADQPSPSSTHEANAEHPTAWPPRQLAVMRALCQGKANKEIAHTLRMDESTVKVHVRYIVRKLGVNNRTQAALYSRRMGIVPNDGASERRTPPSGGA